ncbi:MAG: dUTP diphosphatase [Actinomycetota bacterium]
MLDIPLLRLDHDTDQPLAAPRRIRAGDAAADLPARHETVLRAGARALVPTGFAVALPPGVCGLILPRSGLALEHGITVLNAPGLIDSGYRGELKVLLWNTGANDITLGRGERVAQLLVLTVAELRLVEVDELPGGPDDRGGDGFGSSGRR